MNRARQQFLTGAGFARDESVHVTRRDSLRQGEHVLHALRGYNQVFKSPGRLIGPIHPWFSVVHSRPLFAE